VTVSYGFQSILMPLGKLGLACTCGQVITQ
jgi:hypothetical protein